MRSQDPFGTIAARSAVSRLAAFVKRLAALPAAPNFRPDEGETWASFSRAGLGSLWLSGPEADEYIRVINDLVAAVKTRPALGQRIRDAVNQAILEALDVVGAQKGVPINTRIAKALKGLSQELSAPPLPWEVFLPIENLKPPKRPVRIGEVTFRRLTKLAALRLAKRPHAALARTVIDHWRQAEGVAHVALHGYDRQVVNEAVAEMVSPILDSLNFFGDIAFDWKHPAIMYLPGDAPSGRFEYLHRIHNPRPYLSAGGIRVGTLEPFSFQALKEKRVRTLAARVLGLLRKTSPSPFEKRIRAALQWAGRATAERRPEVSLLLYAISLEALMLGPRRDTEQTYRLSLRLARLLGRNRAGRMSLAKRTRDLYAKRSQVVHAGFVGVTAEEVREARWLAKNAIGAALSNSKLRRLTPEQRVEEWFNERMLAN